MVNGVGDAADMGGTGDLRRDPQAEQQDRLDQHAEHRFAARPDSGKRTAGIKAGDSEEETGNGEQVDQSDQVPQPRHRRVNGHHRQRGGDGQHHADHHVRRQAEDPAGSIRANALTAQQLQDIPVLLQHTRAAAVMQARAGDAGHPGQQRRGGEQRQRLQQCN